MEDKNDGTVIVLEKPQNSERLVDILIIDDKHRRNLNMSKQEVELRAVHYHKLIRARDEWAIVDLISYFMSQLRASGMDSDPLLVADLLNSCVIAYPDRASLVFRGLDKANAYVNDAGEGIAIALLEITNSRNCMAFEAQMLEAFSVGSILAAMADSAPTPAGSGRLTNAIEVFTSSLWVKSERMKERRRKTRSLLMRWSEVLRADSVARSHNGLSTPALGFFVDIKSEVASKHEPSFLERFAEELTKRFFTRSTLGLRFHEIEMLDLDYIDGMAGASLP